MKHNILMRGIIAFASLLCFASCQDEDFGYTLDDVRKSQYSREFTKTFGEIDPDQDWTMATLVKANVNLPQISGTSKMNIMTGDPHLKSSRLLAQIMLQDGIGSANFDAIKGNDNVFVTVEKDGKYKYYRNCSIVEGTLSIGNLALVEVATRSLNTPSMQSTGEISKKGSPVSIDCISFDTDEVTGYSYNYQTYSLDEWKRRVKSDNLVHWDQNNKYNNSPFTDESLMDFKRITGIDWGYSNNGKYGEDYSNVSLKSSEYVVKAEWNDIKDQFQGGGSDEYYYFYPQGKSVNSGSSYLKSRTQYKEDAESHINEIIAGTYNSIWTIESLQSALKKEDCNKNDNGAVLVGFKEESTWQLKSDVTPVSANAHPQWQYINNVPKSDAPAWNFGLGYSLFGPNAFFEERVAYYDAKKLALYGSNDLATMESGFKITTTGGSITLPYIFGCTDYYDQFGYIYWKDGEDPLLQPHYVLMDDARPSSNIRYGNGTSVGNMELSLWGDANSYGYEYALAHKNSDIENYINYAGKQVVGTAYTLVYFDENGNASTTFPAGLNIAFFIDKVDNGTTYQPGNYNYSLPELNTRLYSASWKDDPTHCTNARTNQKTGAVKAITWSKDGNYYLGFGDNSGDQDLNDIVFMVEGAFNPPPVVEVSSVKWHLNLNGKHDETDSDLYDQYSLKVGASYTQPSGTPTYGGRTFLGWAETPDATEGVKQISGTTTSTTKCYYAIWSDIPVEEDPEPQSWLFACEDLGGSHDYDFNDVVWEVTKTWDNGVCTGKVQILAAGGTLPFTLKFKGSAVCTKTEAFSGIENETIVNAGNGTDGLTSTPITVSGIGKDWSADMNKEDFSLTVESTSGAIYISAYSKNENGKIPQVLVVPSDWEWPTEGTIITDAYPNFNTSNDWSDKVKAKVYNRSRKVITNSNSNLPSASPGTTSVPIETTSKIVMENVVEGQLITIQEFVNAGANDNSTICFYIKNNTGDDHSNYRDGEIADVNWSTQIPWISPSGTSWKFDYSFSKIKNAANGRDGIRTRIWNDLTIEKVTIE